MTITITELQSFNLDNSTNDPVINPSSIPNSSWTITSFTPTQILASTQLQGHTLSISIAGSFNTTQSASIKTFADFSTLAFDKSMTITSQSISFDGQPAGSMVSTVPILAGIWSKAGDSVVAAQILFAGKQIFNTGTGTTSGDRFYGYSGYATYNNNHLYSSTAYDSFVGGSGGVNTLVLPANKGSYSMTTATFWDTNAQASSLSGWELKDTAKKYATVDISNVQRIQFKDTSLALDVNGNAGTVAKVLGAVFGSSYATNKQFVGIGLSYLDSGTSYAGLMSLALTVKLGAGYTNAQEIQLLTQNLFGHTASASEVAAIDYCITSGQYTQASLGVLAAETTNNAAKINLVGLAQTGIEYTPAG